MLGSLYNLVPGYGIAIANELLSKGLISPLDAERYSLACSDCAKITISGKLCCPKHYIAIADETGNTIYLGPDDQTEQQQLEEQRARQEIVQKILNPFMSLLSGQKPEDINE